VVIQGYGTLIRDKQEQMYVVSSNVAFYSRTLRVLVKQGRKYLW